MNKVSRSNVTYLALFKIVSLILDLIWKTRSSIRESIPTLICTLIFAQLFAWQGEMGLEGIQKYVLFFVVVVVSFKILFIYS